MIVEKEQDTENHYLFNLFKCKLEVGKYFLNLPLLHPVKNMYVTYKQQQHELSILIRIVPSCCV